MQRNNFIARLRPLIRCLMQLSVIAVIYEFYPRIAYQGFGLLGLSISAAIWFADITRPLLSVAAFYAFYPINMQWHRSVLPNSIIGIICASVPLLLGLQYSKADGIVEGALLLAPLAVLIAIHASFMEEVFFRGFLLNWMINISPPLIAVIPQALLFGMFHLRPETRNMASMLWFIGFALCMGFIRIRTGSIWPGIALHFGYDFASSMLFGATRNGLKAHGALVYSSELNELFSVITFSALLLCIVVMNSRTSSQRQF